MKTLAISVNALQKWKNQPHAVNQVASI